MKRLLPVGIHDERGSIVDNGRALTADFWLRYPFSLYITNEHHRVLPSWEKVGGPNIRCGGSLKFVGFKNIGKTETTNDGNTK